MKLSRVANREFDMLLALGDVLQRYVFCHRRAYLIHVDLYCFDSHVDHLRDGQQRLVLEDLVRNGAKKDDARDRDKYQVSHLVVPVWLHAIEALKITIANSRYGRGHQVERLDVMNHELVLTEFERLDPFFDLVVINQDPPARVKVNDHNELDPSQGPSLYLIQHVPFHVEYLDKDVSDHLN